FERGADPGITDYASRRCAQLILQTAGGRLAEGVVDACPRPAQPRRITLRHHKVNELLGIELRPEEIDYYLGQLGLKKVGAQPRPVDAPDAPVPPSTWEIPTFRVDLKREADLIEEVCRLHGVDKIPATPPRGALGRHEYDAVHDELRAVRQWLTGLGLDETQGQTLINRAAAERTAAAGEIIPLERPLSSDMDVLRPSLLPGLLDILRHNLSHKNLDVALFEIGRVFRLEEGRPVEQRRVAIALTGRRAPMFWSGADREARFDLHDLKGILEEFFEHAGLAGVHWQRRPEPTPLLCESAEIRLGGKQLLGELGQLLPSLQRQYDLRDPVYLAELNLDLLLARRRPTRTFKPLPQYPSSRRDVAMLVPETVTHADVLAAIRSAKPEHLESVELFDVFRGRHVPEGQKSLAYALTYRSRERTLTDEEVNRTHERVVARLREQLGATIREA
ncbi:MAG: phenylalanine--tRNA ligase subunit beta, partial [Verrucomicrobia bacterium]